MFETLQDAIKHYAKCMKCTMTEAKADAEREIAQQMKLEGCSREFAEATWMENQEELNCAELDAMDKEAKKNGATKVVAVADKPKQKRAPRKPNEEKREIIKDLLDLLPKVVGMNHTIVNPEREISFDYGDNNYSLTLICHRKKKGD